MDMDGLVKVTDLMTGIERDSFDNNCRFVVRIDSHYYTVWYDDWVRDDALLVRRSKQEMHHLSSYLRFNPGIEAVVVDERPVVLVYERRHDGESDRRHNVPLYASHGHAIPDISASTIIFGEQMYHRPSGMSAKTARMSEEEKEALFRGIPHG